MPTIDVVVWFFVLGLVARLAGSPLSVPKALTETLSIYLLLAIGLKGGVEISRQPLAALVPQILTCIGFGLAIPFLLVPLLRRMGFSLVDSAGHEYARGITASSGSFTLTGAPGGTRQVQVARIGYRAWRSQPFTGSARDTVQVRLLVEDLLVQLPEITARSERSCASLEGAAVEAIQIDGAQHEFMTIPNMVEDVTDIVLNVKGLVFRALGTTDEAIATISVDGPCEVTGADFFIPSEFELVNPEQHIATLTEGGHLTMSMRIGYGRGYVSGEANKRDNDPIGVIHVDSLYSPVSRCAKLVEACRVGQHTDYDRLVLEIETNGSIAPRDAVVQAANTPEVEEEASIFAPEVTNDNAELDKQIEDLDLSVRSYNCLKRASIHSVRQLVEFSENDLLNIRNFGVKSIEEVKDKLESMGLSLKA